MTKIATAATSKLCIDCRHYRPAKFGDLGPATCAAFDHTAHSPVDGRTIVVEPRPYCEDQRATAPALRPLAALFGVRLCGKDASLFQPMSTEGAAA